jgi:threonine dehydrogenase-like Zn-dependent dehydrogenase
MIFIQRSETWCDVKAVMVTGPDQVEFVDIPEPTPGPADVVVRPRACGVCGSDAAYVQAGGVQPRLGATILGHEASAEVVSVGSDIEGISVGDRGCGEPAR